MARKEYYELEGFENVYLEDSYILKFDESDTIVSFDMEVVLTDDHPLYSEPKDDEQYCYKDAIIAFPSISNISWERHDYKPSVDASDEIDHGNIDALFFEDGIYHLSVDWGDARIVSAPPTIKFKS